jgi:hypothetical protein
MLLMSLLWRTRSVAFLFDVRCAPSNDARFPGFNSAACPRRSAGDTAREDKEKTLRHECRALYQYDRPSFRTLTPRVEDGNKLMVEECC